jgi:uncharacterized protein (DUF2336 family)
MPFSLSGCSAHEQLRLSSADRDPMAALNLIQELELAVSHGGDDRRTAALLYTTDLLISGRYEDDDVWIFGEVIGQLAGEIETAARAQLAARIAPCAHAPSNVIDRFACDNSIEVAQPVLRHAERLSGRKDIPRHHFQKLIAKASDEVKSKLAAINPNAVDEICNVVADGTGSIHERFGPATRSYYAAKRQVGEMYRTGELTEEALCEFARARKFEELTVALTLLCDLPVNVAERALRDEQGEMVLILAKAAKLSWATAKLLLLVGGRVSRRMISKRRWKTIHCSKSRLRGK